MSDNAGCTHDCSSCSSSCSSRRPDTMMEKEKLAAGSSVKKVIAVVSGKGGVGKSAVTAMLAVLMRRRGFSVAVLDADMTGPSMPKMFGLTAKAQGGEHGIVPVATKSGIKLMSVNLLLENDTDPVVWRGPVIAGAVKQFWSDVLWGEVDYMFIDMPPGTGDVPLTVFQSLPVDGIVVVATPQQLVSMIVEKAFNMAKMMKIPVMGMVENMSYYVCPNCERKHPLFGEQTRPPEGIKMLARIPLDRAVSAAADAGDIESVEGAWLDPAADAAQAL